MLIKERSARLALVAKQGNTTSSLKALYFINNHQSPLHSYSQAMELRRRRRPGAGFSPFDLLALKAWKTKNQKNQRREIEAANTKPFLETGLGSLAPEIRQSIFKNLLAVPPPYAGRDFRAEHVPIGSQPPNSLTAFVDLKASQLNILETCRQVYTEAFPLLYARKAYYIANAQDFKTFFELGGYWEVGPLQFRFDTITCLCLSDLVIMKPKWGSQLLHRVMYDGHTPLEARQTYKIDYGLDFEDLDKMKSLRKICLCMHVGQESKYHGLLFSIPGLRRGVIEIVDDFNWTIRSQSELEDDWNLQYAAFGYRSYLKGRNFEDLDYGDIEIQRKILDVNSRASNLVEGDERWVEVTIGERNYEELKPPYKPRSHPALNVALEDEQVERNGEAAEVLMDDDSDQMPEILEAPLIFEEVDAQTDRGADRESDDLQGQPAWEENQPDLEPSYPQKLTNSDVYNAQAAFDTNTGSGDIGLSPNEGRISTRTNTISEDGSEDLYVQLRVGARNAQILAESNQTLNGSAVVPDDEDKSLQEGTDASYTPTTISSLDSPSDIKPQIGEGAQATTNSTPTVPLRSYRDAQTQTESAEPKNYNAETQTEPMEFTKILRGKEQAKSSSLRFSLKGEDARDHHKLLKPILPQESQRSALLLSGSTIAAQSLPKGRLQHCFRMAYLAAALALFLMLLSTKMNSTLDQLSILFLSILFSFVAAS